MTIQEIWNWVWSEKEWLFGGVGVAALVGVWRFFQNRRDAIGHTQIQRGGHGSKNTQVMTNKIVRDE